LRGGGACAALVWALARHSLRSGGACAGGRLRGGALARGGVAKQG